MSSSTIRTAQRRTEIRLRILMIAAAVLFVVGVVIFFQAHADRTAPTAASKEQLAQPDQTPADVLGKAGGTLVPAARKVAGAFLLSALRREHLQVSWDLATPELRSTVTHKQWLAGVMPVTPFPVRSLASTGFKVVTSNPNEVMLQVLVLPPVGDKSVEALRYDLTLVRRGGRWLVSSIVPYAPLPVQAVS